MTGINDYVVVTGANSGIGKDICKRYISNGYNVIGIDMIVSDYEYPIIKCDISNEANVKKTFEFINENITSSIKYLINVAGIFCCNKRFLIEDMNLNEWSNVINNNLTGTMLVTKYALKLIEKSKGDKAIINLTSDQVFFPRKNNSAYAVSKSGIDTFTKICATEFLGKKIRVNSIAPSSVKTNFINPIVKNEENKIEIYKRENNKMPFGLIEPSDISDLVEFLGSEKARKITGQTIIIDSGLYSKGE